MKIKKNALLVLFSFMVTAGFSQQFTGYNVDNYAGINGVLDNPAYLAASKFKVNVNLAAFNFLGGNNAYEFDRKKIFSLNFSNFTEGNGVYKSTNTDNKYLYANADIVGPSFMITTGPKSGFGIITRMRVVANEYNLSNSTFQLLGNSNPAFESLDIQDQNVHLKTHAFAEAGISYGRILLNKGNHFLKAGITAKYIIGLGAGYVHSNSMLVNLDPTKMINKLSGDVDMQYSANLDNFNKTNFSDVINGRNSNTGWGFDVGFQYEWRPGTGTNAKDWLPFDQTPYKLRVSVSGTDIGMVKYANSLNGKSYLINGTGHPSTDLAKADNETYDQYFSRLQTEAILVPIAPKNNLQVSLPTALRFNVDYHVFKRIFINASGIFDMIGQTSISANYITSFALTPRFEKKWFSIYAPVSYNVQKQLNMGAGFRLGPLFAGSGSILSNYFGKKNITGTDFHVGLSVPIYQHGVFKKKKKEEQKEETKEEVKKEVQDSIKKEDLVKDRDHDGVTDDRDSCPDVPGVVALNGCPDKDGDGIADKDDKCPDTAGVAKYGGCPVPDTDHDGVNDDDDKCPLVKGVADNHGCPPIKKSMVTKVSNTAKKIYFVTGKTNLQKQSFGKLNELAKLLKADTSLHLTVEGYSDNIGTEERKAMFAENRANAVKDYLVQKGVSPDHITATGLSDTNPIADNNTFAGRSKNRRVEMHLTNY